MYKILKLTRIFIAFAVKMHVTECRKTHNQVCSLFLCPHGFERSSLSTRSLAVPFVFSVFFLFQIPFSVNLYNGHHFLNMNINSRGREKMIWIGCSNKMQRPAKKVIYANFSEFSYSSLHFGLQKHWNYVLSTND